MQNLFSIPKPCNENWDTMTPKEQGRHCAKCNIVVKDFSIMSNEEILTHLNKNTGHSCGRFTEYQLEQQTEPSEKQSYLSNKLRKFVYAFAICFLPLIPFVSFGQSTNSAQTEVTNEYGSIKGKVIDANGKAVPFAIVSAYKDEILHGAKKAEL